MGNYRQNLKFLVNAFGGQTTLARKIGGRPTQPIISAICSGKRDLKPWEAPPIERALGIPEGWLGEEGLIPFFWPFIDTINHCYSLNLPYPYPNHLQEMKGKLHQLADLLKRSGSQ